MNTVGRFLLLEDGTFKSHIKRRVGSHASNFDLEALKKMPKVKSKRNTPSQRRGCTREGYRILPSRSSAMLALRLRLPVEVNSLQSSTAMDVFGPVECRISGGSGMGTAAFSTRAGKICSTGVKNCPWDWNDHRTNIMWYSSHARANTSRCGACLGR